MEELKLDGGLNWVDSWRGLGETHFETEGLENKGQGADCLKPKAWSQSEWGTKTAPLVDAGDTNHLVT